MPIASQLSVPEELISVCAASVLVTGLVGAMFCQRLLSIGGFTDPMCRGLATAAACHGFGTAALAAGEVALAVHSPRPFHWTGNVVPSNGTVVRHRDVCAALNAEVNSSRLVLQMRTGAAHHVPTSRRDCYAAAELGAVWNGSRAMRRVCDLLPAGQPAAPSQQRLVEPIEQFWRRMRARMPSS